MYKFTDPGEPASEEYLPSEAVLIDGTCIDQEIDGYQTLTVSGREQVNMDYSERKIGNNLYLEDYYQTSRIIEVQYHLQADTPEELIQKFDKLNGLLNFKEAKIQFADDPGCYYIGSKTEAEAPPVGVLSCVSTYQIYCPDPHKYSVAEKEFIAKLNASGVLEATIYNDGTAAVPIDYTIHNNHDNGYVGIVTPDTVLQIGRIAEVDEVPYQQSENLINTDNFSDWERDTSAHPENPVKKTNGQLKMNTYSGKKILQLADRGAKQGVNGGMVSMIIPPDSEGIIGAKNFYCYFNLWFETGAVKQVSTMSVNFLDKNDELIFCYMVEKNQLSSNKAHVMLRAGGSQKHKYFDEPFEPSNSVYGKNMFDWQRGNVDVIKMGSTVGGYFYGVRKTIDVPDLADKVCTKIQLYIGGYDELPMVTGSAFRSLIFQKHNVEKWEDIPNRFPAGSTIEVDGRAGKVYTDGLLRPDDEVRGSDYPLAPPGESKVQFYYSNFSDPAPDITAKIREGWL
ncbi:distal tail protein Dit [Muricomes intestini]|jgi:predicted phage tail component-like protein|uniref:distal tail protein Dit n=1 Tax=Muricomes intestini TaxID=1796634 RepID=UPI002FDDBA38